MIVKINKEIKILLKTKHTKVGIEQYLKLYNFSISYLYPCVIKVAAVRLSSLVIIIIKFYTSGSIIIHVCSIK